MTQYVHSTTKQPRPEIELTPVESSQVKSIGYDATTTTLAFEKFEAAS